MEDDLDQSLRDAWARVRPRLEADPRELARRLARRQTPLLTRPPRAWCLALRASDLRLDASCDLSPIDDHHRANDPRLASDPAKQNHAPPNPTAPPHPPQSAICNAEDSLSPSPFITHHSSFSIPHLLTFSSSTLRKLTCPVTIDPPGEPHDDIARKLGVHPSALLPARCKGVFQHRYIRGLSGRRGKPVPLLYTDKPLDPSARLFAEPDPAWLWTARHLHAHIPDDFPPVTLTRVPVWRLASDILRRANPPHPDFDGAYTPGRSYALPPPPPDAAWYKWTSDGQTYLGDNPRFWRKDPSEDGIPPGDPRRAPADAEFNRRLETKRRRNKNRIRPSRASGSLLFNGWAWLCPACGRRCRTLYLPLSPPLHFLHPLPRASLPLPFDDRAGVRGKRADSTGAPIADISPLHSSFITHHSSLFVSFACHRCHRVRAVSTLDPNGWNVIITYLTAGLLYGREVPRPRWFQPKRKRAYAAQSNRPAPRRQQILRRLLNGWTLRQIADDMKITIATIYTQAADLFRQENVPDRYALARKYNSPHAQPLNPIERTRLRRARVRDLLLAGLSYSQIFQLVGTNPATMERDANVIYKSERVHRRRGLCEKYALPLTTGAD